MPGQIMASWLVQKINAYRTLTIGLAVWSTATIASGLTTGWLRSCCSECSWELVKARDSPPARNYWHSTWPPSPREGQRTRQFRYLLWAGFRYVRRRTFDRARWLAAALHRVWSDLAIVAYPLDMAHPCVVDVRRPRSAPRSQDFANYCRSARCGAQASAISILNYPFYMVLSWLPLYLVKSQGYSISAMAKLSGVVYALATVVCLGSGWLADRWIARGASTSKVRMAMICSVYVTWVLCITRLRPGKRAAGDCRPSGLFRCDGIGQAQSLHHVQTLPVPELRESGSAYRMRSATLRA